MKKRTVLNTMQSAIIFDLDETLLDEKTYRIHLFQKLLKYTEYKNKNFNHRKIKNYSSIKKNIYKFKILNFFLNRSIKNESFSNLRNIYYSSSYIPLIKNSLKILQKLKKKYLLCLITDGNELHQFNKIYFSGLLELIEPRNIIINSKKKFMKPSINSYQNIILLNNLNPVKSFYVGDNPKKDFKGAKKVGLKTIRVIQGKNRKIKKNKYIDYEIKGLKNINTILKKIK